MGFDGMPQVAARGELVAIATAGLLVAEVARVRWLGNDPLRGPLGDADGGGDLTDPDVRVL